MEETIDVNAIRNDDGDGNGNDIADAKAPIYITIGPPCAGKTTLLSKWMDEQQQQQKQSSRSHTNTSTQLPLEDITIDDQNGVHIPTPTSLWLTNLQPTRKNRTERTSSLLRTVVHGKTISERIYDDVNTQEMRFVIQRLHGVISAQDFRQCVLSLNNDHSTSGNGNGNINGNRHGNRHVNNSVGARKSNGSRNENDVDRQINSKLRQLYKKDPVQRSFRSGNNTYSSSSVVDWKESLIGTVEEFRRRIINRSIGNGDDKNNDTKVGQSPPPPPHPQSDRNSGGSSVIQLFVVESIFKNPPSALISSLSALSILKNTDNDNDDNDNDNINVKYDSNEKRSSGQRRIDMPSGLNAAMRKLNHLAMKEKDSRRPLSWGNTNSKQRDYAAALDAAEKSQRPVIFIPFMNRIQRSCINVPSASSLTNNEKIDIEIDEAIYIDQKTAQQRVEMNELFQRNIQRCFETGKYVPMKAIIEVSLRVDELVDRAVMDMKKEFQKEDSNNGVGNDSSKFSKFQLDATLSKFAGFHMNGDRTVRRIGSTTNSSSQRSHDQGLERMRYQQRSQRPKISKSK